MTLFQLILAGIAAAVVIAVTIAVSRNVARPDPPPAAESAERPPAGPAKEPGFLDVVKNPELWRTMTDAQDDVEREVEAARGWSDERVARAVRWYVWEVKNSRHAWGNLTVLQKLGGRTRPEVLRILGDPALRARLVEATQEDQHSLPEAPFNRLCKLLAAPPPETVALLVPFAEDPSSQIRQDAVRVLCEIDTQEALTAAGKALRDPNEYVRWEALRGLTHAIEHNRVGAAGRRDLFDSGLRLLGAGDNVEEAAHFLLKLDRERAVAYLLSDAALSLQSKALYNTLNVLNEERISVPRARLLALVGGLTGPDLKYPQTYQLCEALRALGRHKVPGDREVLTGHLAHPDERVAAGAAAGVLASHGLEDFRQRIWGPPGALTVPQRHYRAVTLLDSEVRNGGFTQYFFNSSGGDWRDALAGLEAMGSKQRLAVFREVLAKFGASGPSGDREKRMNQLSKLANAEDKLFDALDCRYYGSTEVLDVLGMRYILANPEAFR